MLVDVCARCGSLSMRSESVLCEVTVVVAIFGWIGYDRSSRVGDAEESSVVV